MGLEMKRTVLDDEVINSITQRLSLLPDLRLPYSFTCHRDSVSEPEKKSHLMDLLQRDAAVFLERHGYSLTFTELQEFEVLKEDYEVNWHLKQLKNSMDPSQEQQKANAAIVKNRRLAFMDRLIEDGQYFSEDAMRMRAPLLHHEYLGKFQDPSERAFARPGERWSDMLIRQAEEVDYQARLKTERVKAGLSAIEEEEEEEDEDSDEEEKELESDHPVHSEMRIGTSGQQAAVCGDNGRGEVVGTQSQPSLVSTFEEERQLKLEAFSHYMQEKFLAGESSQPSISGVDLESKMEDFTRIMQEKFLSGDDSDHFDYVSIDRDTTLDDYWLREMSQDAEDKYFEED